jgi:hypothetical protein
MEGGNDSYDSTISVEFGIRNGFCFLGFLCVVAKSFFFFLAVDKNSWKNIEETRLVIKSWK